MPFYLKILNEVRHANAMKVDGYSGARFIFRWDPKQRAYIYAPKNQDEVDDLYRTMGRSTAYIFAPVAAEFPAEVLPPVAPVIEVSPSPAISVFSTEQLQARGVVVETDDDDTIATRLISAYDKGATDTLSRLPKTKRTPVAAS